MYQLINPQIIFQYFGDDDEEMLREMIQIILDTNFNDLKHLEQYYVSGDLAMVKKKCHKSKPSMSYVGAMKTRKLLEEIEADLENSHSKYLELLKDLDILDAELNSFLKNL
ncbi:Hpt domain-containing protein [Rhodonellum sp.]|uniref:Hpt domain-containing protein n=1 Tax=Rhodonellum sp. TaxID=2231180 RepID=UPI002722D8B0|nr:Hpt domain-containing protein [Rhodonellum sp.]MDO9553903.1 Hpt domain-containing protein [Rhodonellum sp.]